jgi:hypothetical protein
MKPKRTFEAIRKAVLTSVSARNSKPHFTGKDNASRRAFQYAMFMRGEDAPHSLNIPYRVELRCTFAKAADGSTRVRRFDGDEIPHWDFVPEVESP